MNVQRHSKNLLFYYHLKDVQVQTYKIGIIANFHNIFRQYVRR